jgi:ElaB/YqjD/DUF883 family membrane-anchored ribosome-binding protein
MTTTKPEKFQFYAEHVFASKSSTIPERLRKDKRERTKWSIRQVVAELVRDPGACPHVDEKEVPVAVYGYAPERLHEYADNLELLAGRQSEPYTRRGKDYTRAQKSTTPILLAAVASLPPGESDERRAYWALLVTGAAMKRWGKRFRSIIAHVDESHYHLHILVDNVGASVKSLHMGHAAAQAHAEKARKGDAYRAGCSKALDWYWREVGEPMGWLRQSPAPRPRMGRAKAAAQRARQLEEVEEVIDQANQIIKQRADKVKELEEIQVAREANLRAVEARLRQREAEVAQAGADLIEMRLLIENQQEFQRRVEQLRGPRPIPRMFQKLFELPRLP